MTSPVPTAAEAAPQAYPAAFTVHTMTGPVPACVKHARQLINLSRLMGVHAIATAPEEGAQCSNCVNEAKKENGRG